MRTRILSWGCLIVCCALLGTLPAHANGGWTTGGEVLRGDTTATSSGDTASVDASTRGQAAPAPGWDYVVFDEGPVGADAPVDTRICRRTNAGEIDPSTSGGYRIVCFDPSDPEATEEPAAETVDPVVAARHAAAQLTVPPPAVTLNPDPANNQWNAWPIGLPVGIRLDDPAPVQATGSSNGLVVSLTASRGQIHLDWGDGATSVCTAWDTQPRTDPRTPPVCGHTYQTPGKYTVTATAAWTVTWSALGQSGTLAATSTTSQAISIKEFQAVITG